MEGLLYLDRFPTLQEKQVGVGETDFVVPDFPLVWSHLIEPFSDPELEVHRPGFSCERWFQMGKISAVPEFDKSVEDGGCSSDVPFSVVFGDLDFEVASRSPQSTFNKFYRFQR